MNHPPTRLLSLIEQAKSLAPIRVAVVNAAQEVVIGTLQEAHALGLIEPRLIGEPETIGKLAQARGWPVDEAWIVPAKDDPAAAARGVQLVRHGQADAVMKGYLHTDTFMHALLDGERGLRAPGRRVSHVFVTDIPGYSKLLLITDAAINIAPELSAKAQMLQNAVEVARMVGVDQPKVAVLSAVETVTPAIVSTLDGACLTLMARRGQINGALVDGPLAFDNAISAEAAREKEIVSEVAGEADIVLVPDLVSGNILAKDLEYLAGARAAGIVVGLSAPVVLGSRTDPASGRLAALALAGLIYHRSRVAGAKAHTEVKEVVKSKPGNCPICGMALEPRTVTEKEEENAELADTTLPNYRGGRGQDAWHRPGGGGSPAGTENRDHQATAGRRTHRGHGRRRHQRCPRPRAAPGGDRWAPAPT